MKRFKSIMALASALLCAALLALMLVDLIAPHRMLFLNEPAKHVALAACLVSGVCGALCVRDSRRAAQRRKQRQKEKA